MPAWRRKLLVWDKCLWSLSGCLAGVSRSLNPSQYCVALRRLASRGRYVTDASVRRGVGKPDGSEADSVREGSLPPLYSSLGMAGVLLARA